MRGLGGLIMRTAAVRRRCASDSAAHGTGLAAVLLATSMCWLAAFRHAEPFSPKLLRHRTTEGTMTGVVVTHDLAPQGFNDNAASFVRVNTCLKDRTVERKK